MILVWEHDFLGKLGFLGIGKINVNGMELGILFTVVNIFYIEIGVPDTKINLNNLYQIFKKYVININN